MLTSSQSGYQMLTSSQITLLFFVKQFISKYCKGEIFIKPTIQTLKAAVSHCIKLTVPKEKKNERVRKYSMQQELFE